MKVNLNLERLPLSSDGCSQLSDVLASVSGLCSCLVLSICCACPGVLPAA